MAGTENSSSGQELPRLSPVMRSRLQKCFEYGNKKMQQGEHDYATEMFIQCVQGDPANIIYIQSYLANLRVKYENNKKGASFGFLKGSGSKGALKTAEVRKNWAGVYKSGLEILKTNPWDDSALMAIGRACLEQGFEDAALAWFKHGVESNPDNIENNRFVAHELEIRGMFDQALACWNRVLKVKPDDVEAGRMISDILLKKTIERVQENSKKEEEEQFEDTGPVDVLGKKLSIEDTFEIRLKKNPEDRTVFQEMIDYYTKKMSWGKAEDACRRALKTFPDDAEFLPLHLDIMRTRAKIEMERIAELYKKDPSEEMKARYLKVRKVYEDKKIALLKYKLEINPQNGAAHYEYGQYYLQHNEMKEAIMEFQAAKADNSIKADCLIALGWCFQQIKQYRLSMMHYDQALEILEGEGDQVKKTLYCAARLAFALGEIDKADNYANRLAAIDFSYKDLGDLLDKIEKKRHN